MKLRRKSMSERVLRIVDGTPTRRRLASRVFARYYGARGADRVIVQDALAQSGALPLAATRSTMRWAAALGGGGPVPLAFRPERRLQSAAARTRALELLDGRIDDDADPELRRHRHLLRDRGPHDPELQEFVTSALADRLAAHAAAPVEGQRPGAALGLLVKLHTALSAAGLRPFLVSGTLLGVVRDGRLLDHDYDIDIGILPDGGSAEDVGVALAAVEGLQYELEEWRVWGRDAGGVAFDVFVHYEERGRYYHATRTHSWWNSPFDLEPKAVGDNEFWVPDDTDAYLTENYGDWRAPTVFYDKTFDTPNLELRDSAEAVLFLYELVLGALDRGDRYACESGVRMLADRFGIDVRAHFSASPLLDRGDM